MSGAQSPLPVFVRACVPAETPMRVYGCCYGLPPPRRGESFTYLRRQHSATARSDQGATSQRPAIPPAYPCLQLHPHQQQQEGTGSAGAVPSPPSPLPSGGPGCSTGGGRRTPRGPAPHQRTQPRCTTTPTDSYPTSHSFFTAPAGGYGVRRSRPVSTQPPALGGPRVLPRWWPMHPSRRALRRTLPDGPPKALDLTQKDFGRLPNWKAHGKVDRTVF